MTQHTPGPWVISDAQIAPGGIVGRYIAHKDGGMIAEALLNCRVTRDADMEANARLIAAAPDLLAALRIAADFMSIASDWNIDEAEINGEMKSTYDWLEVVQAAIAKATGSAA